MAHHPARARRGDRRVGGRRARRGARVRQPREARRLGRGIRIVVGIVLTLGALAVAAGSSWTIVQIAEAGSRAVWEGSFSDEPLED